MLADAVAGSDARAPLDVEFKAKIDGTPQKYVVILPEGFDAAEEHHVLICLHGHGSDRWQYVRDKRDECRGARDVAQKHKLIFVSPDYRAATSWMGPKAEADLVQIIEELRQKHKVGKVFLNGASMGGTSVLVFTALHPDLVAGVASVNGTANMLEYENFAKFIGESYGGDKTAKREEYEKRSPEKFPEKFTMPVAITAGGKDNVVPPASVLRLAEALKKRNAKVLLILRENGGHATNYDDTVQAIEFVITTALAKK
jgi:pimeloyl-ACP methyl ester carboxylesterase